MQQPDKRQREHTNPQAKDGERYDPRQLILVGFFGAMAVALPFLFHLISLGKEFLPLFIPIAIASFLLELRYSMPLCVLVPVLSFFLTGMPPILVPPIGIIMMVELLVMVACNRTFYGKFHWNIYFSAFLAIFIDRLVYLAILFFVADILKLPKMTFTLYAFIKSMPGIVLLIALVPSLVLSLQKIPFFGEMKKDGTV